MQFNRDQFMEEGYLVLREVIPPAGIRRFARPVMNGWSIDSEGSGQMNAIQTTHRAASGRPAHSLG